MNALLRLVRGVDDTPAVVRQFARLHDPSGGVLVIRPTPGRGEGGIARDILRSLGKRFDIPRTPRAAPQLLESARIWLRAEQIRRLIIMRANGRPAEDWQTLIALRDTGLEELWLILQDAPLRPDHRAALNGTTYDEIAAQDMSGYLPRAPPDRPPDPAPGAHPPVPRADFVAFLARCSQLLGDDDLKHVASTYREAQQATGQWLDRRSQTSPAEVFAFIGHLASVDSVDRALTRLRGAQARLLLAGLLLQIDAGRFAAWHDATLRVQLTAPISQLLRAFASTRSTALAALSLLTRWSAERLSSISIADIDADATELRGGHPVPDHARALIRAHLLARTALNATPDAPLFTGQDPAGHASTRLLNAQLDAIGELTGLQFVGRQHARAPTDEVGRWAAVTAIAHVQR